MSEKKIYIGLDIGSNSVGYAVTDDTYTLQKYHGEPMWGSALFDEAKLNTERRTFRTARRRLDRRKQRVKWLEEIFAPEILKIDERFFRRLKASALYREDSGETGSLFGNEGSYTDAEYHRQYPTIHHLICSLMSDPTPHDVRLVYLACSWLVSHRGHFLNTVDSDKIEDIIDFSRVYSDFRSTLEDLGEEELLSAFSSEKKEQFGEILRKKTGVNAKLKKLKELFPELEKSSEEEPSTDPKTMLRALGGGKIQAKDLFGNQDYQGDSFTLSSNADALEPIFAELNDGDRELLENLKALFDWGSLSASLAGEKSVSQAKIAVYEKHAQDLKLLKRIIRKYAPDKYNSVFRATNGDNYTAYSGHASPQVKELKKTNKEVFSQFILKIVNSIHPDEEDRAAVEEMKERLKDQTFLPKQKNSENCLIPHQLYLYELKQILKQAEGYLPFLKERDREGLSVSDKICKIFTFRVPYYVGPLNKNSPHAWVVKFTSEKTERILPWNFERLVDEDESEAAFIRNMTNTCTYLPDNEVLPKNSLLYEKFQVLNEINPIAIDGQRLSVEFKQRIYHELFEQRRKVTPKAITEFLLKNNQMEKGQQLSGIDTQSIKSNLKSWHDFRCLLKSGRLTEADAEKIIERRAYTEDKKRFEKWLRANFQALPEEDIAYISRLKYSDFGRLSREFLTETYGSDRKDGTGEAHSIIELLWKTNCNLNELLSDKYTFREQIEDEVRDYYNEKPRTLDKLESMRLSNSVKRPVLRSLVIVKEVVKAVGAEPAKIFVEMTRGGVPEEKKTRTKSRREQLLELYDSCKDDNDDVRAMREELERLGDDADSKLQQDRLFLYFTQLGKCMYSGDPISLEGLGTRFDIDHIYPQSLVKDDSILNNKVLVCSHINQGEKKDIYPIDEAIRTKMRGFWTLLLERNLITEEKYRRLTRSTPFSDEEKMDFIQRQLTETSQSVKAVTTLLKEFYPHTEIVYVKARLTSEFRQAFDIPKSRQYNDLHHAKDAYLNIVTGNVYNMRFTKNIEYFNLRQKYTIKTEKLFTSPQKHGEKIFWRGAADLEKVKSVVAKNNAHLTVYSYCKHGGFFDDNPLKAAPGLIPRKKNLPSEKYGGYNKASIAFFLPVWYRIGKKSDLIIMPVDLLRQDQVLAGTDSAIAYAKERVKELVGKPADELSLPLGMRIIKINTLFSLDGFRIHITGVSGGARQLIAAPFTAFCADAKVERYIKRLESFTEKCKNNPKLKYQPEYDKLTPEENLQLYDLYIHKLKESVYQKRPNNPVETLLRGREAFEALDIKEQAKALLNIHTVFDRNGGGCDLTAVGGSKNAGVSLISTKASNWKNNYSDVRIVDQSASGIREKQSCNLLELI